MLKYGNFMDSFIYGFSLLLLVEELHSVSIYSG